MFSTRPMFRLLTMTIGSIVLVASSAVSAKDSVKLSFQLDWRLEGPTAPFFLAQSKGYFQEEGLDVTFDVGSWCDFRRGASGACLCRAAGCLVPDHARHDPPYGA